MNREKLKQVSDIVIANNELLQQENERFNLMIELMTMQIKYFSADTLEAFEFFSQMWAQDFAKKVAQQAAILHQQQNN
jgi:hypothetical protein